MTAIMNCEKGILCRIAFDVYLALLYEFAKRGQSLDPTAYSRANQTVESN